MKKLAIISTHPIQYNAPLFRLLSENRNSRLKVFYTWSQAEKPVFDPGFGLVVSWDIPLLEGYDYQFVQNTSNKPGSNHFSGIKNPGLIAAIDFYRPDAILVFGWSFQSHLACLRHYKGKIPVFFRGDSTLLDDKPILKKLLRRILLTWVYRHIDYALYVGKNNKEYFLENGLKKEQLVFAPHAIDNQRFIEDVKLYETEALKRRVELGIEDKDSVILFAGKLEDKKDPGLLLRLADSVPGPDIRFLIVGNGHLEKELKEMGAKDSRIIFLDFQNQRSMPVIYRMADIFILPSVRNETWGLAINEAMICKRPVIASAKVGCVPDLVIDGVTGLVFVPGPNGEEKVSGFIKENIRDKDKLRKMGTAAYEKIQEYSFQKVVFSISELMEGV